MDNDNFSFLADAESSITGDKTEGYTPKKQELIHQLVQERLGKKNAIEFESLDDYVVPPKMFFSMIKKPAVSIRANRMEFSMSAIRLFEGVQHVLPMLSENKKRQSFGGAKGWSCTTYTTWSTTMVYAFSREMYRVITHGKM